MIAAIAGTNSRGRLTSTMRGAGRSSPATGRRRALRGGRLQAAATRGTVPLTPAIAALAACLCALLLAWPALARAQGSAPAPVHELEIPGGARAVAAVANVSPDVSRARLMLTAIRVLWDSSEGQDPLVAQRRSDLTTYLEVLSAFEQARSALGASPAVLSAASDKKRREGFKALAAALSGELVEDNRRWRILPLETPAAVRRRALLSAMGVQPDALVAQLNAGASVALDRPSDTAPLVFPPAIWQRILKTPDPLRGSLFTRILGERRAALLYYGAASLDPETRAFITGYPRLVESLYQESSSASFALTGRSLRIVGTRVAVPGGDEAAPLWEEVVGASPADAGAFISWLFARDDGRTALLYDAVAHLAPAAQRFVLGLDEPDAAVRAERFRALVRAAGVPLVHWYPRLRPFERVIFDVPHVLVRTRFGPDRRPLGPASARFWETAFASSDVPEDSSEALEGLDRGPRLDAAQFVEFVAVANMATRRERAEAWLFAQRVFPSPAPAQLPDVLVAIRGFGRYRALALTLERMGVVDPSTYARAVRVAGTVSNGGGERAGTLVAEYQGALSLIERARFARAIDAAGADRLVRALCDVPRSDDGEAYGGVAAWIDRQFRPAFGAAVATPLGADPDRQVETHVLAAMAGAVVSSPFGAVAAMPTIEWEGLRYRIDPATSTLRRLLDVRERQGGQSLDAILALARTAEAALAIRDRARATAHVAELSAAVAAVKAAEPPRDAGSSGAPDLEDALAEAAGRLRDLDRTPDAEDLARAVRALRRAAEWHLARVLASLAYAPHVGEPDSPALLAGDPSSTHDFKLSESREDVRLKAMWDLPEEVRDATTGWRVTGSLLGLDVALGRFALRRVPSEVMPESPALTDIERRALTEPVVLTSPFDQTDDARGALVAAVRRGRARLTESASSPDALAALGREAGLDEWRLGTIPWLAAHEPARLADEWSLGELVRLGTADRGAVFDGWGVSGASADGNLTCAFPWDYPWTTLAGRKSSRAVAGLVPDLAIALAEALADMQLPARLSVGVLSVATQDLLDKLRTNHSDDWLTLAAVARLVPGGRIEDYVAALTIGGALVPADTEQNDAILE